MALADRLLLHAYQPTTFLERGVAVPFTSPVLVGTRARPAERGGTELLIPNPSGGPGVYILPWAELRQFCRPTMHDTKLNTRVAALAKVSPETIRYAAIDVAAEGLAGRMAQKAMNDALASEEQDRLLTNFLLLVALVRQNEPAAPVHDSANDLADPGALKSRARQVIGRIAPGLNSTVDSVATALEELAQYFTAVGIRRHASRARHARTTEQLALLQADAKAWAQCHQDDSAQHARLLADAASITLACVHKTIEDARALPDNMLNLLRSWQAEPERTIRLTTRPEWLLDGWQQIILVWRMAASEADQRAALAEIAFMVPVMPREAVSWIDGALAPDAITQYRKFVRLNQDWRTQCSVFALIARNEQIRALAT